jgi:hypothetical protein
MYCVEQPFESGFGRERTHGNWEFGHGHNNLYDYSDSSSLYREQYCSFYFPPIPTISSPGGQSVYSVTPSLMSSASPIHSIADRKTPEVRILIGFSVADGVVWVLVLLVPLPYALHLECIDKKRTEQIKLQTNVYTQIRARQSRNSEGIGRRSRSGKECRRNKDQFQNL